MALGEACSIVIRGATQQILDEADRSLHDALCVLSRTVKETKIVYGGGKAWTPNFLLSKILWILKVYAQNYNMVHTLILVYS